MIAQKFILKAEIVQKKLYVNSYKLIVGVGLGHAPDRLLQKLYFVVNLRPGLGGTLRFDARIPYWLIAFFSNVILLYS